MLLAWSRKKEILEVDELYNVAAKSLLRMKQNLYLLRMNTTTPPLTIQPSLLSANERTFLDKHGYVSLGKILDDMQLTAAQSRIQELLESEGKSAGSELLDSPYIRHPKEEGADRLADLVNKGDVFDIFLYASEGFSWRSPRTN